MKYTVHNNFSKENNVYNWKQGCHLCKKPFEEQEKFTRVDVQNGIFRGDDKVFCFHKNCQWTEKDLKK